MGFGAFCGLLLADEHSKEEGKGLSSKKILRAISYATGGSALGGLVGVTSVAAFCISLMSISGVVSRVLDKLPQNNWIQLV